MLLVLALVISYLSVFIPPDLFWVPSLFGLAYPFLLIANALFVFFWLLIKPRNLILSLLIILIGWNYMSSYFQFERKTSETVDVKIISYNVEHFMGDGSLHRKQNAEKIIAFLEEQEADIICLQEARLRKNNIFNLAETVEKLETIKHYQFARTSTTYGSVTMTRYPIINMGEIRFDDSRNITIYTDVFIKPDTIRIFNVHLQSYNINPQKYSIIESPGITEEENIQEVQEMGAKLKTAFERRARQVREIRKHIDQSPYPVIVCGDFNDTPISFSYQTIGENLQDAFVNSGTGIGRTYIGELPSFRIDYIFHDDRFESYNFETYDFKQSDHLPISCGLVKID